LNHQKNLDSSAVPRQIQDILERVRLSADYMPKEQREVNFNIFLR